MPDEFEDAMRDPELRRFLKSFLFTRGPVVGPFDEVLDTPVPERLSALLARPQGDGTVRRALRRMLNWRGRGS